MHDSNQFKHGILSYFKSIYMGNLFVKMREKIVGLYKHLRYYWFYYWSGSVGM